MATRGGNTRSAERSRTHLITLFAARASISSRLAVRVAAGARALRVARCAAADGTRQNQGYQCGWRQQATARTIARTRIRRHLCGAHSPGLTPQSPRHPRAPSTRRYTARPPSTVTCPFPATGPIKRSTTPRYINAVGLKQSSLAAAEAASNAFTAYCVCGGPDARLPAAAAAAAAGQAAFTACCVCGGLDGRLPAAAEAAYSLLVQKATMPREGAAPLPQHDAATSVHLRPDPTRPCESCCECDLGIVVRLMRHFTESSGA